MTVSSSIRKFRNYEEAAFALNTDLLSESNLSANKQERVFPSTAVKLLKVLLAKTACRRCVTLVFLSMMGLLTSLGKRVSDYQSELWSLPKDDIS